MPKQDCIIDACSYIYLHKFRFKYGDKQLTPFDLLNSVVNIKHHKVISDEIKRNVPVSEEEAFQINKREYELQKYTLEHYDKILYNNAIDNATTDKDKGEKVNLISALDIILKKKTIPIYLTDDIKAIRSEQQLLTNFLLYNTWTSFDAILFLFLTTSTFSYEIVKAAITDFTAFIYKPTYENLIKARNKKIDNNPAKNKDIVNEYTIKISDWRKQTQDNKIDYLKRIEVIKTLKNR